MKTVLPVKFIHVTISGDYEVLPTCPNRDEVLVYLEQLQKWHPREKVLTVLGLIKAAHDASVRVDDYMHGLRNDVSMTVGAKMEAKQSTDTLGKELFDKHEDGLKSVLAARMKAVEELNTTLASLHKA